jgi:dihydroorotase
MSSLLLAGGRVVDPANDVDMVGDVLIVDGAVLAVGPDVGAGADASVRRVDCTGKVVCPGLIDMHVHLREPGDSAKETVASGTRAAARGGFTTVVCMPNTSPAIDSQGTVALVREKADKTARVRVLITGAITKGREGAEMAPIGSLKKAGVVAISDDGNCLQNNELMRRAMEYAAMFGLPVLDHCQDRFLVSDGVMNEGYWSAVLGLRGWPVEGEELVVARDILLAERTGCHVHCQNISAAGSVQLLRDAKARGVSVSGEASPHHFTLTDAAIAGAESFWREDGVAVSGGADRSTLPDWPKYDTRFKMNPPLRTARDRAAVLEGLADGTIEVISSDHAPHCDYEKEVEFDYAPFGITGLETALSLSLTHLYHPGRLDLPRLIEKFTTAPARILRQEKGTLSPGAVADVTVIDPEEEWVFDVTTTAGKATNSPFHGWSMKGRSVMTIVGGRVVWPEEPA